jgi:hypothetical protein
MRSVDIPSGAQREVMAGHVWDEVLSGGGPITLELKPQQTFRVSAVADTTVHYDSVTPENLAMTVRTGEVEYLNAGTGTAGDNKTRVTIVITGDAYVQVARQLERGRRTK